MVRMSTMLFLVVIKFLSFIKENKNYYSLSKIDCIGTDFYIKDKFEDEFHSKMKNETFLKNQLNYLFIYNISSLNEIIKKWIADGFEETIDEMVDIIKLCSPYNFKQIY